VGLSYNGKGCSYVQNYQKDGDGALHGYAAVAHKDLFHGSDGVDCRRGDNPFYDDEIFGWRSGDELYGEDGHDYLHGGVGPDRLYGGAGTDQVVGGPGDDYVSGGAGSNDSCWGGDGIDIFSGCEHVYA
jgi:Ca2+-binding RTX toxin-like protein